MPNDSRTTIPNRPFYFSRTAGGYPQDVLGLGQYLLMQGLARKLLPNPPAAGKDTVLLSGRGYVDVTRSRSLWFNDFLGQQAVIKRGTLGGQGVGGDSLHLHHDCRSTWRTLLQQRGDSVPIASVNADGAQARRRDGSVAASSIPRRQRRPRRSRSTPRAAA